MTMSRPPPRVFYSCVSFVLIVSLVIFMKPRILFLPTGQVRPFSIAKGGKYTTIPLGAVILLTAIVTTFFFAWLDMIQT